MSSCAVTRHVKRVHLFFLFVLLPLSAQAQTPLTGHVEDGAGEPVPGANVLLLAAADSALIKGAVTNGEGAFLIEAVAAGNYRLRVSFIGYRDYRSDVLTLGERAERDLGVITLREGDLALDELVVEGERSLFEQRGDRLVVNVGSSVTLAGTDALEVLERSPGVVVNEQAGTLSMVGKSGVQVMVNGKLSNLPADALLQYLAGLSADAIESIELITSPPASMDAEGDAGFVNIVLKRSPDDGLSGTTSLSGGYGGGDVGGASVNATYQRGQLSLQANYAFARDNQDRLLTNYRRVEDADGVLETPAMNRRDPLRHTHNVRLGLDYAVTPQTSVGGTVAAYDNRYTLDAATDLRVRRNGTPVNLIFIEFEEFNHWRHAMGNLHLRHQLQGGGTLSADADYLYYRNENPTGYLTTSTDIGDGRQVEEETEVGKTTPFRIGVVKADYEQTLGSAWEIGVGVKGSFSRFTNDVRYGSLLPDVPVGAPDERSELAEDVLAAYAEADYQLSAAASVRAGLRFEHTRSNLTTGGGDDLARRHFGSLFPSLAYTHTLGEGHRIGAAYTRRITRPAFSDLAPFVFFVDPYTFFTGNVALQPAVSSALKLDYTRGSLFASVQYTWEDSTIARFQNEVVAETNLQRIVPANYRGTRTATALVALPVTFTAWWRAENSALFTWQEVDGSRAGTSLTRRQESARLTTTHTVNLPYGFDAEVSAFYQSASLAGLIRFEPYGALNLGLQKALPNGWGRLALSVSDAFETNQFTGTTGSPDGPTYVRRTVDFNPRTLRLTYTTRFGGGKAARNHTTASEDEQNRVQ